ncbi:MAG: hypothetical protein GXP16_02650 [Gammaproteobacteria bacterium]|nr:hypothetical protein [Gammaproteobacteria bacterium]
MNSLRNSNPIGITWCPTDRLNLTAALSYRQRRGWLLHQADANFTTFNASKCQTKARV